MKIFIGFIVYGETTAKYLPYFLLSLKNQTCEPFRIIAFNNGPSGDENVKYVQQNYPEIELMGDGKNLGFAAAYNKMINRAFQERAEYFLMVNPDVLLEPDVLEKLASRLASDAELGTVCPKILKWDFINNRKTEIIDTYGIALKAGLHFYDLGQGESDSKKFRYASIVGPSGACGLYRMAALERVKVGLQYLDERMFMYKEDCDLAYRLFLTEWESCCVSEAVVYHDRTALTDSDTVGGTLRARSKKGLSVRKWSVANQQLIVRKYWHLQNFSSKIMIIAREIAMGLYIGIFERELLGDYLAVFKGGSKK